MRLEDQCITLLQAQTLEGMGIKQVSAFHWLNNGCGWKLMPDGYFMVDPEGGESYAAFNVVELGEMFPFSMTDQNGRQYSYYHRKNWRGQSVGFSHVGGNDHIEAGWHQLERSARYDLLITMISAGHISVDEINERYNYNQ